MKKKRFTALFLRIIKYMPCALLLSFALNFAYSATSIVNASSPLMCLYDDLGQPDNGISVLKAKWCQECTAEALRTTNCSLDIINGECVYATSECKPGFFNLQIPNGNKAAATCQHAEFNILYHMRDNDTSRATNDADNPATYVYAYENNDPNIVTFEYPSRPGYRSTGWYTSDSAAANNDIAFAISTTQGLYDDPLDIYAGWVPETYRLDFVCDTGESPTYSVTKTYGVAAGYTVPTVTDKCEKIGYTPNGWNCVRSNPSATVNDVIHENGYIETWNINSNVVCTAQWIENTYYIDYRFYTGNDLTTFADMGTSGTSLHSSNGLNTKTKRYDGTDYEYVVSYTVNNLPLTITAVPVPRTGYDFDCWNNVDTNVCAAEPVIPAPVSNYDLKQVTTYEAQYNPITYTITYDLNDRRIPGGYSTLSVSIATNFADAPASYNIETPTILLGTPTRKGYSFLRWLNLGNNTPMTEITRGSTGNKSLLAQWQLEEYSIEYNLNDGLTHTATNSVDNPSRYTVEGNAEYNDIVLQKPDRLGYTFTGWTDEEGNPVNGIERGNIGDRTFTAHWVPTTYIISYNWNGGTEYENVIEEYTVEDEDIVLGTPTRTGYNFVGWYEKPDFSDEPVTVIYVAQARNVTLYAKWVAINYIINFSATNGYGSKEYITCTYDQFANCDISIKKKEGGYEIDRTGYNFVGWARYPNVSAEFIAEGLDTNNNIIVRLTENLLNIAGETTLYAIWQVKTVHCSVGEYLPKGKFDAGDCRPCEIGFYCPDDATWDYNPVSNQGMKSCVSAMNNNAAATTDSAGSDSVYDCWAPCPELTGYILQPRNTRPGYYEYSEIVKDVCKYSATIVYENTGTGSSCPDDSYTIYPYVSKALCESGGTKIGETFTGWIDNANNTYDMTNGSLQIHVSNFTPVEGIVTMTATWRKNVHNLTYKCNDTSDNTYVYNNVEYGTTQRFRDKSSCVRTGQIVDYWECKEENSDTVFVSSSDVSSFEMPDYNVVCNAKWRNSKYTIKFDKNNERATGLTPLAEQTNCDKYEYNEEKALCKNGFVNEGYTFNGWCSSWNAALGCITTPYADEQSVKNLTIIDGAEITLYALWQEINYTISYDLDGGQMQLASEKPLPPEHYNIKSDAIVFSRYAEPVKTGYDFGGWIDPENNIVVSEIIIGSSGEKHLKAKWSKKQIRCDEGWYLPVGSETCQKCEADNYCGGGNHEYIEPGGGEQPSDDNNIKKCPPEYPNADEGAASENDCYQECPDENYKTVTGGIYPNRNTCEYTPINYNINYILNGGTNFANAPTTYNLETETITLGTPTKKGYNFDGWYNDNNVRVTSIPPQEPYGDLNLTARWTEQVYHILYKTVKADDTEELLDYVTPNTYTVTSGIRFPQGVITPDKGYKLAWWYKNKSQPSSSKTTGLSAGWTVDNLPIYAKWNVINYTINYVLNGGRNYTGAPASYNIESGTVTFGIPTKTGYKFNGWSDENGDFITTFDENENPVTTFDAADSVAIGNRTFTANWTKIDNGSGTDPNNPGGGDDPNNPGGGDDPNNPGGGDDPNNPGGGDDPNNPGGGDDPNNPGGGDDPNNPGGGDDPNNPGGGDQPGVEDGEYTITYKEITSDNDEITLTDVTPNTYRTSEGIMFPKPPVREGYTFKWWYKDKTRPNVSIKGLAPGWKTDITIYAKWEPTRYTIKYNMNGGTNYEGAPGSYNVESETITLGTPTKAGYVFVDWHDENDTAVYGISAGSTGDRIFTAIWEEEAVEDPEYIITYKEIIDNEEVVMPDVLPNTYKKSTGVVFPVPTKTGYTFKWWYQDPSKPNDSISGLAAGWSGDITVYAKWVLTNYTITYNLNGGTNYAGAPTKYTIDDLPITLGEPTKTGYIFDGWKDADNNDVTEIPAESTGNKIFTAQWTKQELEDGEYNITYKEITHDAGEIILSGIDKTTYKTSEGIVFSAPPAREGYKFKWWYQDPSKPNNSITGLAAGWVGDVTVYAKREPIVYTINYNLDGGMNYTGAPANYNIESETITLGIPTKTGYIFNGWKDADNNDVTGIPHGSIGNKTFTAQWVVDDTEEPNYTITYKEIDKNGNEVSLDVTLNTYKTSQGITFPAPSAKTGYTFKWWYKDKTRPNVSIKGLAPGWKTDMTVYAKWEPTKYSISYNLDGGTNYTGAPVSYTIESLPIEFTGTPVKTGYAFAGWKDETGTFTNGIPVGTTGNKTFDAIWVAEDVVETQYNITYKELDDNGHVVLLDQSLYHPNTYVSSVGAVLPTNMNKSGYTFAGWYAENNSNVVVTNIPVGATGNKTFIAHWTKIDTGGSGTGGDEPTPGGDEEPTTEDGEYTITYKEITSDNTEITLSVTPNTYKTSQGITFPAPSAKTGYTFKWWYKDKTRPNVSIKGLAPGWKTNITVYAKWESKTIHCDAGWYLPVASEVCSECDENVSGYCPGGNYQYNPDANSGIKNCPAEYPESDVGAKNSINDCYAACQERDNYNIDAGSKNYYNDNRCTYTAKEYDINYVMDNSAVFEDVSDVILNYTVETPTITRLPIPRMSGKIFIGWKDATTDEYVTDIDTSVGGGVDLYANWVSAPCDNNYYMQNDTCTPCPYGMRSDGGYVENCVFKDGYNENGLINYHITYVDLFGATNTNSDTYTVEDIGRQIVAPGLRKGYDFDKWTKDGVEFNVIPYGQIGDITLKANWIHKEIPCEAGTYLKKNTLTCSECTPGSYCPQGTYYYDELNDQGIESCSGEYDKSYAGAQSSNECYKYCPYDDNAHVYSGVIFADGMEQCRYVYSIQYELNGGEFVGEYPEYYEFGPGALVLPIPAKENYRFMGWYFNSDFSDVVVTAFNTNQKRPIKLYAKWIYNCESGVKLHIGNNDSVCVYNQAVTHPALGIMVNGQPYYMMMTDDENMPMHAGTSMKLRVKYNGQTYNVYDSSVIDQE